MAEAPPGEPATLLPLATREELRGGSLRSGAAQLASRAAQLILLVGSGMALARLLTPTDFGLVAMVSVVVGFVESIRHFGLQQAALHHDDLSAGHATALFWSILRLTGLTALAMMLAAPLLALFYGEPRVTAILLAFAVAFAVRGLTAVHEAVLMRRLRFGGLALAELAALAAATATGLAVAWLGYGYRALVAQALVLSIVYTAFVWWRVRWRPGPPPRAGAAADVRPLLAYGADLTRFQMLAYVGRNADRVLVGYFSGARALGFYDAAYRWSLYPVQEIYAPLTNVALASLARVRDDAAAYRRACRLGLLPVFTAMIPALVFLALEAERTILVLLGGQWVPAIPLFRVLCVGAVGSSIIKVTRWIFMAEGRTARQLRWGLTFTPVMIAAAAAGVPWGPLGVATGYTLGTWIMVPSAISTCLRDSALRPRDLLAAAARPTLAAALAAAAAALLGLALPGPVDGLDGALVLLRQAAVFATVGAIAWIALPGGPARARELAAMVRDGARARGSAA